MARSILDNSLKGIDNLSFNPVDLGMAPLPLNVLVPGTEIPADLYLAGFSREKDRIEMVPAASRGATFRTEWRENLIRAGQKKVYVALSEAPALTDYFNAYTKNVMDDPKTTRRVKSDFVREMSSFNLRLLFSSDLSQRAMERAVDTTHDAVNMMMRDNQILTRLSELLRVDYSLYSHSVNVSMLAMGYGRFTKLTEGQVRSLGLGGMLMEVGMARIDSRVRNKSGELTQTERAQLRLHPRHGYEALKMISAVPYDVLMIVLSHHENVDGSGTPNRKSGDSIPRPARIIRVLDTYDAMTSPRPYRPAKAPLEAGQHLQEQAGKAFDPAVVATFLKFMGSPYFRT